MIFTPTSHLHKNGKDVPLKRAENNGRNHAVAHVPITENQISAEHGQRDEASEPKQHGQRIQAQDGEFVSETRKVPGGQGEVRDGDDHGPDRGEDEEADGIRGAVDACVAIVPVGD